VDALEKLAQDPEADEDDLQAEEWNCKLDWHRDLAAEVGSPEPEPSMKWAERIEQARQLLARGDA
jgi:hypothetical protein